MVSTKLQAKFTKCDTNWYLFVYSCFPYFRPKSVTLLVKHKNYTKFTKCDMNWYLFAYTHFAYFRPKSAILLVKKLYLGKATSQFENRSRRTGNITVTQLFLQTFPLLMAYLCLQHCHPVHQSIGMISLVLSVLLSSLLACLLDFSDILPSETKIKISKFFPRGGREGHAPDHCSVAHW